MGRKYFVKWKNQTGFKLTILIFYAYIIIQ